MILFVKHTRGLLLCFLLTWPAPAFQPDRGMLRRMFEESLARRKQEYGVNDPNTAQAARDLGLFLVRNGETLAARRALTETVAIDESVFGKSAPQTLEDVSALASVSPAPAAAPLLRRAAESSDPSIAGPALSSLAELRSALGDRPGAAAYLRRAVEKAELVDGKEGTIVALLLNTLALNVGPNEGVTHLERALRINRATLGEQDAQTILTEINLSGVLLASGRVDDALAMARSAVLASESAFGAGNPGTADALTALGRASLAKGDKADAERLYRQVLALSQRAIGPSSPQTRRTARELAAILRQTGKNAEADALDRTFNAPQQPAKVSPPAK
jgi:tetratricopeptide (TPR) repeat protein